MWLTRQDNNILTQIGFVVLVGLAAQERDPDRRVRARGAKREGMIRVEAAIEACRLAAAADPDDVVRVHPRRGAAGDRRPAPARRCARRSGIAVFFGMLGVTLFGLFFTPVFYILR